jgi:hypothetical protein
MTDQPPLPEIPEETKQQAVENLRKAAEGVEWAPAIEAIADVGGEAIAEGGIEVAGEVIGGAMEALGGGMELAGGCAEGCSVMAAFVIVLATAGTALAIGWF